MAVLRRPLPRLTRWGFSVCTFRPFPASVRSTIWLWGKREGKRHRCCRGGGRGVKACRSV